MKFEEIDLGAQYEKARTAFAEYVEADDDLFLRELGLPAKSVSVQNEWVHVKFSENTKDRYIIEANLTLFTETGERLGYYCLHEDEAGTIVDDFLVFE